METEACPICGIEMVFAICASCDGAGDYYDDDVLFLCRECWGESGRWECRELHTLEQITDHYLAHLEDR